MATQTVILIRKHGGPEVMEVVKDYPMPQRAQGEVLVKIVSTCVNPVDYKVRSGAYPVEELPKILGGDVAGVVVEADEGSKFSKGDKVMALTDAFFSNSKPGSYAQYASVPEDWLARVPATLPLDQAGGVPLVALTAWQAFEPANLGPGKRVLVQSGAGGVGHMGVQIAKARGCYVVAVCGPKNVEFVKSELGADEVVDYSSQDFSEIYKDQPFDVVLDLMGADIEDKSYKLLKKDGYFAHVLNTGTDNVRMNKFVEAGEKGEGPKYGITLVKPSGEQLQAICDLISAGKVKLVVDHSVALEQVAEAHAFLEKGHVRGKVVLKVQDA